MLSKNFIEQVIKSQSERLEQLDTGLIRAFPDISSLSSHALIVTGIRRCGKSTLLQQINRVIEEKTIYLNFEDPRMAGFDLGDFNRLHDIAIESKIYVFFFDEIQNVEKWENFVRFNLDEGCRILISGSNSSMLSRELGTKLTGRHIPKELFPFSYSEYLSFAEAEADVNSADSYRLHGGFPEMVKTGMSEVLMNLFNDIVVRDIALRHNIKNSSILQQLAVWLISNTGKCIAGNSLRKIFSIGSSSSIMEYLSYFRDAYLFFYVPKFSYSQKVQIVNPKKVYAIDNGLVTANSLSFSPDSGRLFENMVYMQLRRHKKEIYYFSEKNECDFVVFENGKFSELFQACFELGNENLDRELSGITEAMELFNVKSGSIITNNQTDSFSIGGKTVTAIPFHKWATELWQVP